MSDAGDSIEGFYEIPQSDVTARRRYLINCIEARVLEIIGSIARKKKPSFTFDHGKYRSWASNSESQSLPNYGSLAKTIRFSGYKNRQRFALIMKVMQHAHANLVEYLDKTEDDFYCTKRAFFYLLKNQDIKRFVRKQAQVEWAINEATLLLQCAPWEIGFIASAKGLVAGDLTLHFGPSKVVNYETKSCHTVPDIVANVTGIRTTADFVLVVEKDSVFQKLLREDCPTFNKCILITGKGYPDISTRMLVRMLSVKADLPVYALVDANPHGFEIMCVYRYGTLNNTGYREQLITPAMRWLGVHQKDLVKLGIPIIKLTPRDRKKIEHLRHRSTVNVDFSEHLASMRLGKAEIESVNTPMKRFLTEYFIPMKILNREFY